MRNVKNSLLVILKYFQHLPFFLTGYLQSLQTADPWAIVQDWIDIRLKVQEVSKDETWRRKLSGMDEIHYEQEIKFLSSRVSTKGK